MNTYIQTGRDFSLDNLTGIGSANGAPGKVAKASLKSLDISDRDKDISTFGIGELSSFDDVKSKISVKDVTVEGNARAVMSNCMSGEDFAKLCEEGVSPSNMSVEETVTVVDKIKMTLAESGTVIEGYNDDLTSAEIEKITGNKLNAKAIENALKDNYLPVNSENVEAINDVMETAEKIDSIPDSTKKYIIDNEVPLTVDNLYMSRHSSSVYENKNVANFYKDQNGYVSRNAVEHDFDELMPQIEKAISESGYDVNEATINQSKWLISNNLPVNENTLKNINDIESISLPINPVIVAKSSAAALSDGIPASDAIITNTDSIITKAVAIKKDIVKALDEFEKELKTDSKPVIPEDSSEPVNNKDLVSKKRLLEEARLMLTSEVNIHLAKKGVSIDTTDLETLVEQLRKEEKFTYAPLLVEDADNKLTDNKLAFENELTLKLDLFKHTRAAVDEIEKAPVQLISSIFEKGINTLDSVSKEAASIRTAFDSAMKTYDSVGTEVRRDLGDSIKKAFRNVDDILEDLNLESNKLNEKAVRILGYSSLPITEENIAGVSKAETAVSNLISHMTPVKTLQMIREGINPLDMDIYELSDKLTKDDEDITNEKYSEFLFRLEKNDEISEPEKEAFIGIYRLFNKIEKSDGKLVGDVYKSEMKLTLNNLLSSMRSDRQVYLDVKIDESFGALEKLVTSGVSITDQIMQAFSNNDKSFKEYVKTEAEDVRVALSKEEAVIDALEKMDEPVSPVNIMAADALINMRGSTVNKLVKKEEKKNTEEDLIRDFESITDSFSDKKSADEVYEKFVNKHQEIIQNDMENADKYVDVKELKLMKKQLSIIGSMVKQNSYEVPVKINGTWTSVNLKIINGNDETGKVTVTFDTEETGKVSGEFKVSEGNVKGFVATENAYFTDVIREKEDSFREEMNAQGLNVTSFGYASSKNISINANYIEENNGNEPTNKELYTLAKAVIKALGK